MSLPACSPDVLAIDLEWSPNGRHLATMSGIDEIEPRIQEELGAARGGWDRVH
jgi:hypothetical protein